MPEKQGKKPLKIATVLIRNPGKTVKLELYPAEQFTGRPGAEAGRYRLRIDGVWDTAVGKWTFYGLAGVLLRLGCSLSDLLGLGMPTEQETPNLPKGSVVKAGDSFQGSPIASRTLTEPFQGPDGKWRVFLCSLREPVLVEGLKIHWIARKSY